MEEGGNTKHVPAVVIYTLLYCYRRFMKMETQNGKKTKSVSGHQIKKIKHREWRIAELQVHIFMDFNVIKIFVLFYVVLLKPIFHPLWIVFLSSHVSSFAGSCLVDIQFLYTSIYTVLSQSAVCCIEYQY